MNKQSKIIAVGLAVVAVLTLLANYLHHANIQILNPKGPIAAQERHLIIEVTLLMLIVVVPVFLLTFFIAWKYNENNTKAKYSPDFDHSVVAETIWWLIPTMLIVVISCINWTSSHQLDPFKPIASTTPPLTIQVVALDWKWLFIYPEQHIASINYIRFPAHTPLNFEITADAPMNSFWIPQLGGQIYAMPGMATELHLMASTTGSFQGSSANISGAGFANMKFIAQASTQTEFNTWVAQVQRSPHQLSQNVYDQLVQPSSNNKVAAYVATDPTIFTQTVLKYMPQGDVQ